jgi:hypothetical protein
MAFSGEQKAFCVLQFAKTQSIVTVQRGFRTKYRTEPLTDKTVRDWYRKFEELAVYVSHMDAVTTIDVHMLERVWQELDYRIDVCRVTKGGHIEHL